MSLTAPENALDDVQISFQRTLISGHEKSRISSHFRQSIRLLRQPFDLSRQFFTAVDANRRAFSLERISNGRIVVHVWAEENRLAPGGRFQDIVTAALY